MTKFFPKELVGSLWEKVKESGGSSGATVTNDVYSLEETRIGTWIDGRPLYRRVVEGSIPNKDINEVNVYTFDMDITFISCLGFMSSDSGDWATEIPFSAGDSYLYLYYRLSDRTVWLYLDKVVREKDDSFIVIFEYTKTTDSPETSIPTTPSAGSTADSLPSGSVIMFAKPVEEIPTGWHICDGEEGTPDLRGMFVIGAGNEKYALGATGGEEEVRLTVEQLARHNHVQNGTMASTNGGSSYVNVVNSTSSSAKGILTGSLVSKGDNQPHNNLPPYYALYYIMKL